MASQEEERGGGGGGFGCETGGFRVEGGFPMDEGLGNWGRQGSEDERNWTRRRISKDFGYGGEAIEEDPWRSEP